MSDLAPSTPATGGAVAHPAQVYGYWIGGEDQDQVDRKAAGEVMRRRPEVVLGARANRAFSRRVTWYAAYGCCIRQFLDIGAGLPAPGATHETAGHLRLDCRVVYAGNDPLVVGLSRRRIVPGAGCGRDYIRADVRDPGALLAGASATLDLEQPVAVLLLDVLGYVPAEGNPAGIVGELAAALAPGSLIAISHRLDTGRAPGPAGTAAACDTLVTGPPHSRSEAEIASLFGGLPPQWPGVVPVSQWRPGYESAPGRYVEVYGGVADVPPAAPRS
jgi:hypothetical protein